MNNSERTAELWALLRRLNLNPRQAARVMRARGWQISDNIMRDMTANRWQYTWLSTYRYAMACLNELTDEIGQTDFEAVAVQQAQHERAQRLLNSAI